MLRWGSPTDVAHSAWNSVLPSRLLRPCSPSATPSRPGPSLLAYWPSHPGVCLSLWEVFLCLKCSPSGLAMTDFSLLHSPA